MFCRTLACGIFILFLIQLKAEVIPVNNSTLNYNTVYLHDDLIQKGASYELLLFNDSVYKEDQKPSQTLKNTLPVFWLRDLSWGKTYLWRIRTLDKNHKESAITSIRVFRIQPLAYSDYEQVRLDVKKNDSSKNAGGLVCVDYSRSIFKRNGEIVWTIPDADSMMNHKVQVRDLRITKNNTVTFLTGRAPLEIDLDGNILWAGTYPLIINSDTIMYHHDFQKTNRGTFMVMGLKRVYRKVTGNYDPEKIEKETELVKINGVLHKRTQITMLLEFNKEGKLIWFWDANDYITDEDLNFKKTPAGIPNFGSHANAFSENAEGTKIYVGFRDLSRIIKLDKKTKKVELTYGEAYPSGDGKFGNNLFRKQHGATVTNHNSILIFNNNSNLADAGISSVMELRDNIKSQDSVLLWKFDINFDTLTKGRSVSGGIVNELPNSNLLVCAGTLNRIFEVTRKKEVVWDAFVQSKRLSDSIWQPAPQYRCSWVPELKHFHVFTELLSVTNKANDVVLRLIVHNTGTENDSYIVKIFSVEGQLLQKYETGGIKVNANQPVDLSFKNKQGQKDLKIVVQSLHSTVVTSTSFSINSQPQGNK